ncbi:hypothetical protein [Vibrio diabolicus]|uniref:hypothetical protein n=1 Tax=Vibrio diabolicus TaxID=50719 RepID=UPI0037513B70
MAKITKNFTSIRGDTLKSPKWLITEEIPPQDITELELLDGIANGTYTPIDLSLYEIKGQVRATPQGTVVIELPLVVKDNKLSFVIPAETTAAFVNERQTYGYDIQFKTISNGEVTTWIAGTISITTDYTYEN